MATHSTIHPSMPPLRARYPAALCLLGLLLLLPVKALAVADPELGPAMGVNQVERGSLLLQVGGNELKYAAPTLDTHVRMDITGMVARVTVEQRFTNPGSQWVNGVYVFPLPETAAVDRLRLKVGERVIEGQIKPRAEARRIYRQAKNTGRKASLVEQQRPNLFTNRIANIGPGETVAVTIQYQQSLAYDKGRFSIRFPLTIGIRYIPGAKAVKGFDGGGWAFNTQQVPDASQITPPVSEAGEGHDNPVSMDIRLHSGFPLARIESPYHAIVTTRRGPHRYGIELAAGTVPADRDFELFWLPQPGHAPQAALFTQQTGSETYALLMMIPPEIRWAEQAALAREMIYLVDTSGSMAGTSIQQAREALLMGLDRLKPGDAFNIVQFNSGTHLFSPQAVPATVANLARARAYVHSLYANGGTEMAGALRAVLNGGQDTPRLRQVIFLTDGSVGNEAALFRIIHDRLGSSRLYTVGIGSAPNSYFMGEAASAGRGTFTYIGDVNEVREKMADLFEKLEFPVLSDIELDWGGDGEAEHWPNPLPDLYIHEPLLASFKLAGGEKTLRVSGTLNRRGWSTELPLLTGAAASGLDVLWARNKIRSLNQQRSRGLPADRIRQAVTALGLKHHIVTAHTSLVAVDITPSRPVDAVLKDAAVPNRKPRGWMMQTPAGRLPQTATPAARQALIGVLLSLLALLLAGGGRFGRAR